jgi:hypothetical protein
METINMTEGVKRLTRSKKKTFWFSTAIKVCTNSYLDGGSRSEWQVYNLDTKADFTPNPGQYPWTTANDYTLQPGDVVIETGLFCGKPSTPHFQCLPVDVQRVKAWLGVPQ